MDVINPEQLQTQPLTVEEYRAKVSELRLAIARAALGTPSELSAEYAALVAEAVEVHGRLSAKYPDCKQCLTNSVFGGPKHEPSSYCRSGSRAHCSCDFCF